MTDPWVRRALERKREGDELEPELWERLVEAYLADAFGDDVMAALLMATAIRGLSLAETAALTAAMIASGETLDLGRFALDKHSTGGVSDGVSLAAVPLVAACGVPVAKLSGHALGHTGGTLDKLEAIPGVRTDLSPAAFRAQIERIGCAIAAQSARLVPADKRLYALRDRTATVAHAGLIAASIVSKKIAAGAGAIVFDVKTGAGAFMRETAGAVALAQTLVALAARFGRRSVALVTEMDEPLGRAIGPVLEAIEVRDVLRGTRRDVRLDTVIRAVGGEMLRLAGAPQQRLDDAFASGAGYERFVALVEAQGGTRGALETLAVGTPSAVRAPRSGFVAAIDAVALGTIARGFAAADPRAGIVVERRVGEPVAAGDALALVYGGDDRAGLAAAFTIADAPPPPRALVVCVTRDADVDPSSKRADE